MMIRMIGAFILSMSAVRAFAQLPPDVKSDLGPDVPAFKVRPGYRVTRALPNKKVKNIRFIQFSAACQYNACYFWIICRQVGL